MGSEENPSERAERDAEKRVELRIGRAQRARTTSARKASQAASQNRGKVELLDGTRREPERARKARREGKRRTTNLKGSESMKASAQRRRSEVELLEGTRQEHKRAHRAQREGGEKNYKSEGPKEHESERAKSTVADPK